MRDVRGSVPDLRSRSSTGPWASTLPHRVQDIVSAPREVARASLTVSAEYLMIVRHRDLSSVAPEAHARRSSSLNSTASRLGR